LRASAQGAVPLGDGTLALDIDLAAFPLAALNRAMPGQDLGGTLTGSARLGGTLSDPQAAFDLRGTGLAAAPLRTAGIAALDAAANGRFADNTVTLASVTVSGPQGLSLSARGAIPLSGPGMSVTLGGSAPLSLADRFLAGSGTLALNASVSGSIRQPVVRGSFSTSGAQVVDPETNLRLGAINIQGSLDGETLRLTSASAALASGGTVSASGTVSTNAAAGFP